LIKLFFGKTSYCDCHSLRFLILAALHAPLARRTPSFRENLHFSGDLSKFNRLTGGVLFERGREKADRRALPEKGMLAFL
jgi:hypothetical protein